MNRGIWLLSSTVFLAVLVIASLVSLALPAGASLPTGGSSLISTVDKASARSAQPADDLYVANFNCADIGTFHVDRQTNLRAALILQKCGYGSYGLPSAGKSPTVAGKSGNSTGGGSSLEALKQLASPLLGGTDVDVILPDGTYPHITQSEVMGWAHGSTVVLNYNDTRGLPSCVSGLAYSTDSGATFQHSGLPLCSGHGITYSDPIVVYNAALSTWYAGDLVTGCGSQGVGLWTSPDGITWTTGTCAHAGNGDDRESMWVDNNPASPRYGRMYISFNNFDVGGGALQFTHSDDGTTWSSPIVLSINYLMDVQITGDLLGSGNVYVAAMDMGNGGLSNHTNYMFRSTDGGVTWADSVMGPAFEAAGRVPNGFYAWAFSTIWRQFSWGQPAAVGNDVYYDWAQCGQAVVCSGATDHGDINFQRSTDSGVTWSSPLKLNTDTGTAMQWQPSLAATSSGAIYAGWYDEREANGDADLDCTPGNADQPCYARWGRVSQDGGATWQADSAVSDVLSPLPAQPDGSILPTYEGDYDYITAEGATVYDHWTDGRVAINNTAQQDVVFDRINLAVGTPTPTVTGTPPSSTPTLIPTFTPTITPACGAPAWQLGATMTPARYWIQGAVGSDGDVYVANGVDASGTPLSEMARYNPASNGWSDVVPPLVAVSQYTMVASGGKVYIAGGYLGGTTVTSTLQIHDIASGTWSFGAHMPTPVEAAAGAIVNGKLYVVGGDDFSNSMRTTYIYDISSNSWATGPDIPDINGRTNTYGTVAGGLVYVWGGIDLNDSTSIDTLISYDPGTNSWTTLVSANTGGLGNFGGVSPYGTGKLFVTDGGNSTYIASNATHIYDIATNTWTSGPPMLEARLAHAQVTLPDGRVFGLRGTGISGPSDTVELLSVLPCNTPTNTPTLEAPTDTPTIAAPTGTETAVQATSTTGLTTTATAIATACSLNFSDVPPGSTFYQYVRCLACLGIINGYPDGTFKPNNKVTRGQLSKIVSNAAGFSDPQTNQMFQDVPVGSTFQVFIGRLASRGYINGYPCGGPGEPCQAGNLPYFRPGANATRGQITKIISNAAGFQDPAGAQIFEDVASTSTFFNYIQRLANRGVMAGYACGGQGEPCNPPTNRPYFRPGNNATRGQTSKIVSNSFFPNCQTAAQR